MWYVSLMLWVVTLLVPISASAEIYRWRDRNGKIYFSDTLGGIPAEYRDQVEERSNPTSFPPVKRRCGKLPRSLRGPASPRPLPATLSPCAVMATP